MLPVSRGVTPPGVIGNDGHCLGPFADVVCVIFSVNRFVTDCASDRNLLPVCATDIQESHFLLSDTAAHNSSEHIVDFAEYCRIRCHFYCYNELAFMEDFGPCCAVYHQG